LLCRTREKARENKKLRREGFMLRKHALLLSAAALAFAVGIAPSMAQEEEEEVCDTAALAEFTAVCTDIDSSDPSLAYVGYVQCHMEEACALGHRDITNIRGALADAYGALSGDDSRAALDAATGLADQVGMSCDKDGQPLVVLEACSAEDVQAAASGG
jgi:hypothetical protein